VGYTKEELQQFLVVITGGTRGIGFALAKELASQGYALALWYQNRHADAENAKQLLSRFGARVLLQQVDVTDRLSVKQALLDLGRLPQEIYGLVNNAGILQQKPFYTLTDQEWDHMLAVNLKGAFICAQEILPIIEEKGGSIVNIASSGGQLDGTLAVHYAASKAGIISLTKSLARLGAAKAVRINCVSPGLIETEMTREEIASVIGQAKINSQIPLQRVGRPEEIAATVAFLMSDSASYITGQTVNVNGGLYMR